MLAVIITAVCSIALPLAWLGWLSSRTPRSWVVRLLGLLGSGLYVAILVRAGHWALLGWYTRWVLVGIAAPLWLLAAARVRGARAWPRGFGGWVSGAVALAVALLMVTSLPELARSSSAPGAEAVDVHDPLAPGAYQVLQGGETETVNHHVHVTAQRHALDIVGLNAAGFRVSRFVPARLADYEIYGAAVRAPCSGEVLVTRDGLIDRPVGAEGDRTAPLGNGVLIHCTSEDITVVLAHLQPHSVRVSTGDRVSVGDTLGTVGNSGNSTEPHLHLHAVRGRVADPVLAISDAEPVRLRIDGQIAVRNDRLLVAEPELARLSL